jgi:hypothetical protein
MSQPRAHVQGPPRELSPERVMVVGLGGAGCRIAAQLLFDLARRIGEGSPETRFFTRTRDGRLAPRAVFIDPDPVAMAALRAWVERAGAFTVHPEAFYTGPHGASRSHARGAALGEAGVADRAQELVQRAVDTNPLGALVLVHALAGGSGAGLLGPICGRLQKSNPGLPVITASLLPDLDIDPSPLDVQNAAIGLTAVQRGPRMSLLFDNDAAAAHARATAFPSLNVPLARPLLALARALEAGSLQLQELVPPLGAPHAMWVTATLQATGRLDLPGLAREISRGGGALASITKTAWASAPRGGLLLWEGPIDPARAREAAEAVNLADRAAPGAGLKSYVLGPPDKKAPLSVSALLDHRGLADLLDSRVAAPFATQLRVGAWTSPPRDSRLTAQTLPNALRSLHEAITRLRA